MPKKRGRKKKFKLNFDLKPELIRSVLSITFALSGFLVILSFLAPSYSANAAINSFVRKGFGPGGVILSAVLFLLATIFAGTLKLPFKNIRILLGFSALLLSFSSIYTLFCWNSSPYTKASQGSCGGLVGYKIISYLNSAFGLVGSWAISFSVLAISLILISNISLSSITGFFLGIGQKIKERRSRPTVKPESDSGEEYLGKSIMDMDQSAQTTNFPQSLDILEKKAGENTESETDSEENEGPQERLEILPPFSEPQEITATYPNAADPNNLTSIVPSLPYVNRVWQLPPLTLLDDTKEMSPDAGNIKSRKEIIENTLKSFGVDAKVIDYNAGPAVTQYVIDSSSGTKISKIVNLQYDLALALASPTGTVRIEAPIPGRANVGIEVPNNNRVIVPFKSLLTSDAMKSIKSKLGIVLGKDVGGTTYVYDIGKMPHLLVAGATGSGKSAFLHSLIFSILFRATPQEVKFILVDPKRVEFTYYDGIPHLLTPVVTDVEKAPMVFKWAVSEMERRFKLFESAKARNIDSYNEKSGFQALPYIVLIVDELGEIMASDPAAVEKSIIRLAQLARATGIHLVLSIQRPSTNIITGLIKANIPCRIAFNVSSQVDSRVIIDQPGAEKLLGRGDMLFVPPDASKPIRLQGAWVSEQEINALSKYLKEQGVEPEYKEEILKATENPGSGSLGSSSENSLDDLFEEAKEICLSSGKASASLLQRRLSIGYARAARILDELEEQGIIGPQKGSQPREVFAPGKDQENNLF